MRGAGATVAIRDVEFSGFISTKKIDGGIDTSRRVITTIPETGYHRTIKEIEKKNNVLELKAGGNVKYRKRNFHVGLNAIYTRHNKVIEKEPELYNQFEQFKSTYTHLSIDHHLTKRNLTFFGENAVSVSDEKSFGYAFLNGLLINLDKHVDLSLLHRYYDKRFIATSYANAFAESSKPTNEHGVYTGIKVTPLKQIAIKPLYGFVLVPVAEIPSRCTI